MFIQLISRIVDDPQIARFVLHSNVPTDAAPKYHRYLTPQDWENYNRFLPEESLDTSSLLNAIMKRANNPHDMGAGLSKLTLILPSAASGLP